MGGPESSLTAVEQLVVSSARRTRKRIRQADAATIGQKSLRQIALMANGVI